MKLMRLLLAFVATVSEAQLAAGETWYCAINEEIAGSTIQEFRVDGNTLREPMPDFLTDYPIAAPEKNANHIADSSDGYIILHNDKYSLIAESYYSGLTDQRDLEVFVQNIIITKKNGNLLFTMILTHLPAPNEINTVYGSCKDGGK